jgi:putative redox protein
MSAIHVTPLEGKSYRVSTGRHSLTVDQPASAGGDDQGPSPVELFVASLAACVAYYAGSYLARHGLSSEGLDVAADFAMADDRPARVASVSMAITPPSGLPEDHKARLLAVASKCTLENTLRQGVSLELSLSDRELVGSVSGRT